MSQIWSQFYPPKPTLTEKNLLDQSGKVFIVTGGYAGVGAEMVKILYEKNAVVYIAGRNASKADIAIKKILSTVPKSTGRLEFLQLDLDDFTQIKPAAEKFLAQEKRLDVLWNNAGVMNPPEGSKNKQGFEQQLATNCMSAWMFASLLRPLLVSTAQISPRGSVRVTFTGSLMAELGAPKGGVNLEDPNFTQGGGKSQLYGQSKAGNILIASEFAKRVKDDGIIVLSLNPGNLKSELQRYAGKVANTFNKILLHDPIYGAYTELFAGLSPNITIADSGKYVIPWGRFADLKKDLEASIKTKAEGGTGVAADFWVWIEDQTRQYISKVGIRFEAPRYLTATISPEAAAILRAYPKIPFASFLAPFLTTPSRVPGIRAQFQKAEDVVEEDLIARYKLQLSTIEITGVPVLVIKPPVNEYEGKIMLNVHGGGFVMGTARERNALHMASEMGITVYSIEFTLAPEAKYPVARDQCLNVYRQLAHEFNAPKDILAMSSSAGGQILLSALLMAQKENLPMPAGVLLYTPASDISGAGDSAVSNTSRDLLPTPFLLELVKQNYQGDVDSKDPFFSPIYGEFKQGFPPTIITTGIRDLMPSNSIRLYWKLRDIGTKVELFIGEGMVHGFTWEETLPEAIKVRKEVIKVLKELV
ncbi:Short-chain dehydrogenase reductase [Hyphodiscus hymeniophilus]|uniref:Short-chain dehydrogenase reductase n=1 Tax=Hyphodiscus hymeniophilus TaxID=353542 RepID=A0A9P6VLK2_9HELO|nr:Short-chain dehydrogenase reductase [Hyphodiscus hymeniophilus]